MRIVVDKDDYERARERKVEEGRGYVKTVREAIELPPKLLKVYEDGDDVVFTLSVRDAFDLGVSDSHKLNEKVMGYVQKLLKFSVEVREIVFTKEDIIEFEEDILELHNRFKTITVNKDLSLTCEHFKFRHTGRWLKAWVAERKDTRTLKHPIFYQEDVEHFRKQGLILNFTLKQSRQLDVLKLEEERKSNTAIVIPVEAGYLLQIYELRTGLLKSIVEKGVVKYNRIDEEGQYIQETLYFVEEASVSDSEIRVHRKARVKDRYQKVPITMKAPKSVIDNEKRGYDSFLCRMFTLPVLMSYLRGHELTIVGEDDIYPVFKKFDFPVKDVKEHPKHRQFEFQDEAFLMWRDSNCLGTIALPTGSGKTIIALRAVEYLRTKTLIVTPTIEMLRQWKSMLTDWLGIPEDRIGLYYAGQKEIRDITIITFQSGHRRVRREVGELVEDDVQLVDEISRLSEEVGLLIMDEGHHAPAPIFQAIMVNVKSKYRMALTATPYRTDKNEVLAFLAMGDVVYVKDYAFLAREKVVSPIKFEVVFCNLTDLEREIIEEKASYYSGEYYRASDKRIAEYEKGLLLLWNQLKWIQIEKEMAGWVDTFHDEDELFINNVRRTQMRWLMGFTENKFEELTKVLEKHKNNKILVFNEYVKGANGIAHFIQKEVGLSARALTGSTPTKERRKIFEEFRESERHILVTTTVLDEGIDVPDCDVVVIFNATRTKRQMIQRVGRGCRYRPGKIEFVYELVATPDDIDLEGKSKSRWDRRARDDQYILERLQVKARSGGRLGYKLSLSGYYGELKDVIRRELELYDVDRSVNRDITELINIEEQKDLIAMVWKELEARKKFV